MERDGRSVCGGRGVACLLAVLCSNSLTHAITHTHLLSLIDGSLEIGGLVVSSSVARSVLFLGQNLTCQSN